jgi:hypothetical protein
MIQRLTFFQGKKKNIFLVALGIAIGDVKFLIANRFL